MTDCVCPACSPGAVKPLDRSLWKPGQRVAWVYHATGSDPVYGAGVIIPPVHTPSGEGFTVKPDNPLTRIFWSWAFMIEGGIGSTSPIFAEGEWAP